MRSIKINVLSVAVAVCPSALLSPARVPALYTTSVTVNIIVNMLMKAGLKNIKEIFHALFQVTSEIMDSSAAKISLVYSGLCPSENSAIPVTSIHNFN